MSHLAQTDDSFAAVLGCGRGAGGHGDDPRDAWPADGLPAPREYHDTLGMSVLVKDAAFHRNGTSAESFWTVRFDWSNAEYDDSGEDFVAVVFSPGADADGDEDYAVFARGEMHQPRVAVLSIGLLPAVGRDHENAWRGDLFARALYLALDDIQRNRR